MLTRSAMSITSVGEQYVALQAEFYKHSASLLSRHSATPTLYIAAMHTGRTQRPPERSKALCCAYDGSGTGRSDGDITMVDGSSDRMTISFQCDVWREDVAVGRLHATDTAAAAPETRL